MPLGVLSSPPVVLLTLTHAGRTWRHSSRPCDILDGAAWRHYRGGLAALDLYREAPITGAAEAQSQPVELLPDADLAALAAEGHILGEIRAELALWREGDALDLREVYLSGVAAVEGGGFLGQPLRLSIAADDPAEQPGVWPPLGQTISADTWTTSANPLRSHQETEEGRVYPQAIGRAGMISVAGTPAAVPAIPVHPVVLDDLGGWDGLIRYTPWGDITTWALVAPPQGNFGLVSAGMLYPGDGASKGMIQVAKDDGSVPMVWHPAYLYYAYDALGQVVTLARLQLPLPVWGDIVSGGSYYAAIAPPCSGIARRDWRGGLSGAGEVIRWALSQSTITVDWRRTGAALPALDRYQVAGFWDQACSPWEWTRDNLLPLLPCSWIPGPSGLYPVVWRLDATAADADCRLTDGLDCTIDGEPRLEGADAIRSRHTLDYGQALRGGIWLRRAAYHGQQTRATVRESTILHLRRAQQRWGSYRGSSALAVEDVQTSDLVYADATADRVLSWQSRLYSEPWTTLRIVSDGLHHRSHVASLEPGMVVVLTSSRYSLSSRVAHVRRAGWLGGICYADLVILPPA